MLKSVYVYIKMVFHVLCWRKNLCPDKANFLPCQRQNNEHLARATLYTVLYLYLQWINNICSSIKWFCCVDISNISLSKVLFSFFFPYIYYYIQPNSTCGITKYYINSGGCEDSVVGNSTLETLSGKRTQTTLELSSFTNFSVTSEDQNNNIMCQSFSENFTIHIDCIFTQLCLFHITAELNDFSITATQNESVENMSYSVVFLSTHDISIQNFSDQGIREFCFINSTNFTKAVKFECNNISYNDFYEVEFNGLISLSTDTFPLKFMVTFGTEQVPPISTPG